MAIIDLPCVYRKSSRRWRKSGSRKPPRFIAAITRRRCTIINSTIPGRRRRRGRGGSTTSLSTTNNILISRQRFAFFFIFTNIVPLNGGFLRSSFRFSLQLPVLSLILKVLPTLHFFLLGDAVVDHRAGEDDESSHYYFGRWPLVESETGGGVMSRSAGRDGCYSQDVWQNVVDDLRLLCGGKWRKVYFQDR
jgi:hypothetical protein